MKTRTDKAMNVALTFCVAFGKSCSSFCGGILSFVGKAFFLVLPFVVIFLTGYVISGLWGAGFIIAGICLCCVIIHAVGTTIDSLNLQKDCDRRDRLNQIARVHELMRLVDSANPTHRNELQKWQTNHPDVYAEAIIQLDEREAVKLSESLATPPRPTSQNAGLYALTVRNHARSDEPPKH